MYITGYHGTSLDAARSIINSEQFIRSDGPTHWLGNGIYFYADFEDAYNWRYDDSSPLPEAIVHTIIRVEEDKYLDLNSIEGQKLFADVGILLRRSGRIKAQAKFTQENQCSIVICFGMSPLIFRS